MISADRSTAKFAPLCRVIFIRLCEFAQESEHNFDQKLAGLI